MSNQARKELQYTSMILVLSLGLVASAGRAEEQAEPEAEEIVAPRAIPEPYERALSRPLEVLRGTGALWGVEPMPRAPYEPEAAAPAPDEAAPALVWTQRYKPGNDSDIPEDMELADDKSVYVTGVSGLFGDGDTDVITMKIRPNGRARWRRRFNSRPGSFERGYGVASDSRGNTYVAGAVADPGGFGRFLILKYAPAGRLAWTLDLSGEELGGGGNANALDVAVDDFDNIYVTGVGASATSSSYDLVTLKLDPMGHELWRDRWEGSPGTERPQMLRVDAEGNLVVLAYGNDSGYDHDWVILKYSPEGLPLWVRRLSARPDYSARPQELAFGEDVSIHVAGFSLRLSSKVGTGWDLVTAKYTPFGRREWKRIHRGGNHRAWAYSVDVDAAGNVFVGGRTENGGTEPGSTGPDFITIKYDANGRVQWKRVWEGRPVWSIEEVYRVRATEDGGVIVGGIGWPPGKPDYDYIFLRYGPEGDLLWTKTVAGPGQNDFLRFMELDGEGGIYASGYVWNGDEHDILTVKLQEQ